MTPAQRNEGIQYKEGGAVTPAQKSKRATPLLTAKTLQVPQKPRQNGEEVDGGRNGHDDAKPVVHETKVRNPHRREKFQQPRGEDEEEHHFQQTGEETEDATRRCHNAKHLGGEPNMAEGTRDHEEAGSSMCDFQHFARLNFNAVLFEMKEHPGDKDQDKCHRQQEINSDFCDVFHDAIL